MHYKTEDVMHVKELLSHKSVNSIIVYNDREASIPI